MSGARLFGIQVRENPYLSVIRWVRRDSGDHRNPYPRFALRPQQVSEQVDVVLTGRGDMAVSPRVLGIITNVGDATPDEPRHTSEETR